MQGASKVQSDPQARLMVANLMKVWYYRLVEDICKTSLLKTMSRKSTNSTLSETYVLLDYDPNGEIHVFLICNEIFSLNALECSEKLVWTLEEGHSGDTLQLSDRGKDKDRWLV